MIELDTIYNMDCLEGMKMIPDGSIDAVICDLPYGVLNSESEGGSWDSVIPFDKLWEQYKRICKPTAAIVLFAQGMFTADLMQSNRKMWRYNLIWDKVRATGFLNANRMPLRNREDICVFYQQLGTYNPQMEALNGRERNHPQGHGDHVEKNSCYGKVGRINPTYEDKKHPRSIIVKQAVHCNEGQFHPTQKPLDLLRYLVLTYTNPGDVILDNTCGSGTTCLAAALEHRHYIGFETDKTYFDKAVKRIKENTRQLTLF
jgi:site-specific DNA-methyltransferase (adenine-specific)/modification methylase